MNLFSELHIYASRDPNAQPVAVESTIEDARAVCVALARESGRSHFVVEKLMSGQNVEVFSTTTDQITELEEIAACASLTAQIEALIRETIRLEEHDENPGEWGVWVGEGQNEDDDRSEIMGAGPSRRAALEEALDTAKVWASAVEVSS